MGEAIQNFPFCALQERNAATRLHHHWRHEVGDLDLA